MSVLPSSQSRITDHNRSVFAYLFDREGMWVVCPQCRGPAQIEAEYAKYSWDRELAVLTCRNCLYRSTSAEPPSPPPKRCNSCGMRVSIDDPIPPRRGMGMGPPNRRQGCGFCRRLQNGCDPYFGFPFFLSEQIRGEELWAVNLLHAVDMRRYLGATLRERNPYGLSLSAMARLPAWTKTALMRPKVVRALDKMIKAAGRYGLT